LGDLPPEVRGDGASKLLSVTDSPEDHDPVLTLDEVERRHILNVLARFDGHRRKTAEALGIGENTLWRRLKKWDLLS
ncbi:MAG: helix-turn-helix domain-containing protein, partial [Bradymonadaceae bacterium]